MSLLNVTVSVYLICCSIILELFNFLSLVLDFNVSLGVRPVAVIGRLDSSAPQRNPGLALESTLSNQIKSHVIVPEGGLSRGKVLSSCRTVQTRNRHTRMFSQGDSSGQDISYVFFIEQREKRAYICSFCIVDLRDACWVVVDC